MIIPYPSFGRKTAGEKKRRKKEPRGSSSPGALSFGLSGAFSHLALMVIFTASLALMPSMTKRSIFFSSPGLSGAL